MRMLNAPRGGGRRVGCGLTAGLLLALAAGPVQAIQFELDYGDGISGVLNTNMTLGAAMRMQDRSEDLLGKGNLLPNLCGTRTVDARGGQEINFNSCQGINQNDILPAQALSGIAEDIGRGPLDGIGRIGQFTPNNDNGNWNYDRHDLIQAPLKVTQDLNLTYNQYGFFSRWLYFYDFVNNDFDEFHPNRLRADTPPSEPPAIPGTSPTFGAGEAFESPRVGGEKLRQIGTDFQLLDAYFYGFLPLPGDRELTFKVGRQSISWGESTLLVINSLNQTNPVNANNLFRTGFAPEEVFTPVGMFYASTGLTYNLSLEAYYQYEWDAIEAPTPGGFFSTVDVGTNNVNRFASISFGGPAEDPLKRGTPLNNPLSGLTDSTTTIRRRLDNEPSDSGQWGLSFKYFAENLNNGTDIGLYFMNYHSKLPYASFFATDLSCARTHPQDGADGNATGANSGVDAFNTPTLLLACPNLPAAQAIAANLGPLADVLDALGGAGSDTTAALGGVTGIEEGLQLIGTGPVTDAVPLDTVEFRLDYPEDLKVYGISFNTTAGDLSFQGELAYRPNLPVQVDAEDLTFAALGPTLASCHRVLHPDFEGQRCGPDPASQSGPNTFNLIPATGESDTGDGGDAPSVQRSFPAFITSYRGITLGENEPNGFIRGFEHVKALQYNLGATYILGKTDNPIGADQVIMLFEVGATQVLNMPEKFLFQIDAPGTFRHASAGVVNQDAVVPDGTEETQEELARARMNAPGCFPGICVGANTDEDYIGDGMRFNPQQETRSYTTGFSWGYRMIGIVRYESVLPGISLQPLFIIAHDVNGIAPGPGENFIEGRKNFIINFEIRYKNNWAFFPGYAWWTGGGSQNLLRDRDLAQFYLRYQF